MGIRNKGTCNVIKLRDYSFIVALHSETETLVPQSHEMGHFWRALPNSGGKAFRFR